MSSLDGKQQLDTRLNMDKLGSLIIWIFCWLVYAKCVQADVLRDAGRSINVKYRNYYQLFYDKF